MNGLTASLTCQRHDTTMATPSQPSSLGPFGKRDNAAVGPIWITPAFPSVFKVLHREDFGRPESGRRPFGALDPLELSFTVAKEPTGLEGGDADPATMRLIVCAVVTISHLQLARGASADACP